MKQDSRQNLCRESCIFNLEPRPESYFTRLHSVLSGARIQDSKLSQEIQETTPLIRFRKPFNVVTHHAPSDGDFRAAQLQCNPQSNNAPSIQSRTIVVSFGGNQASKAVVVAGSYELFSMSLRRRTTPPSQFGEISNPFLRPHVLC